MSFTVTPLNDEVPDAKIRAFGVQLKNGKGFTLLARNNPTLNDVRALLLDKWPELKKENGK